MVTQNQHRCLIVGNYCHDVLIKDDVVLANSLGGAASFISAVLDGLDISAHYVSKVGPDFSYSVTHPPIISPSSKTTLFHAHFSSQPSRQDRILKRIQSCDPISPSDLPDSKFDFGMAVGVAGEILPETLEKMLDICETVFVDVQGLIRVFNEDGTVRLVGLKESGFFHLLPRIGFVKASAEEAVFVDIEEARRYCCIVVTNGKDGCSVYSEEGELGIAPFGAVQVDPTGAGDSFLGGFVAGLVQGLEVPDAALLGNFFGSLTVGQIGLPELDLRLFQRVKDEVQTRKMQCNGRHETGDDELRLKKPIGHEQFYASLGAANSIFACPIQECQCNMPSSPKAVEQGIDPHYTGSQKCLPNTLNEEPIKSVPNKP